MIMENEVTEGILDFMLSGKAEFLIFQEPDKKFKYSIKRADGRYLDNIFNGARTWFVKVEDIDTRKVSYQGYLHRDFGSDNLKFTVDEKKCKEPNIQAINGLMWVIRRVNSLPEVVHVIHYGKCSVCGRPLSDLKSIHCGIGPKCREKISNGIW